MIIGGDETLCELFGGKKGIPSSFIGIRHDEMICEILFAN